MKTISQTSMTTTCDLQVGDIWQLNPRSILFDDKTLIMIGVAEDYGVTKYDTDIRCMVIALVSGGKHYDLQYVKILLDERVVCVRPRCLEKLLHKMER